MRRALVLGLLLLMPTAVSAQGPAPPDPLREVRVLRQELRGVRKELSQTRGMAQAARAAVTASEERLQSETQALRGELRAARDRANLLTGGVVLLGALALLALLAALRRSSDREPLRLAGSMIRIADLRAQLAADEARLAELTARATKEREAAA